MWIWCVGCRIEVGVGGSLRRYWFEVELVWGRIWLRKDLVEEGFG